MYPAAKVLKSLKKGVGGVPYQLLKTEELQFLQLHVDNEVDITSVFYVHDLNVVKFHKFMFYFIEDQGNASSISVLPLYIHFLNRIQMDKRQKTE